MLKQLINLFGTTLYIQIWEDRLRIVDVQTQKHFNEPPLLALDKSNPDKPSVVAIGNRAAALSKKKGIEVINPFSHPRVLCADFSAGEQLLSAAISTLISTRYISPSPVVVIHPMEKLEGGLTQVEGRWLRELVLGAGAREAVIHTGNELSTHDFDYKKISQSSC